MTKKILFCTILLLSAFSLAQTKYFELTPKWLVSVQDSTKNYIVVDVQNSNTEQLYKKAIKYVNEKYKNPEAVLRGRVENEFLTFVTHDDHMFDFRNGVNLVVEVNYLTTISFKENKIKINFHDIEMT